MINPETITVMLFMTLAIVLLFPDIFFGEDKSQEKIEVKTMNNFPLGLRRKGKDK